MDPATYLVTQQQVAVLEQMIRGMPLDDMLIAIGIADTVGPILDPSLYRDGMEPLRKIRHRVEALAAFQRVCIDEPIGAPA